jgi:hypothetical protein
VVSIVILCDKLERFVAFFADSDWRGQNDP